VPWKGKGGKIGDRAFFFVFFSRFPQVKMRGGEGGRKKEKKGGKKKQQEAFGHQGGKGGGGGEGRCCS